MGNTLGLSLLVESLLATSGGAGSNPTSLKLRSATLKSALVGHMRVTRLDGLHALLFLVAGVRDGESCQAQSNDFVEDHCDCRL